MISFFLKYNFRHIKLQGKGVVAPHHTAKADCFKKSSSTKQAQLANFIATYLLAVPQKHRQKAHADTDTQVG